MKINIYDFDGTIYHGDSSIDFYKFCIHKKKKNIWNVFPVIGNYCLYFFKIRTKTQVKEVFFQFLKDMDSIEDLVEEFWQENQNKIKKFYKKKNHKQDIIISASPEFLLKPICKQLKVKDLIASKVDSKTGKFLEDNCKGEEKVKRLYQKYPKAEVMEVYTDSKSDFPLIDISKNGYFVKENEITKVK